LTGLQECVVADRQRSVRGAMGRELPVVEAFLTGSYRRQTLITPLSTADPGVLVDSMSTRSGATPMPPP
jgi:hypothetical protein